MFQIKPLKKPAPKAQPAKAHSAFAAAMDDDNKPAASQTHALQSKVPLLVAEMSKQSHRKMLDETSKYVMEDPTIYDYDSHYDDITTKRHEIVEQKKEKKESRYIDSIMKHSEKRKIEQTIITEKIAEKELQREGLSSNGQKYITKGYLKMVEDNKKFLEEDAAKEAYNKAHAASSEDNMAGLYQNLYKDESFMGGRRPDLANMVKESKKEAANMPTHVEIKEASQQVSKVTDEMRPQETNKALSKHSTDEKAETVVKPDAVNKENPSEKAQAKEDRRRVSKSKSRSRSREKSPLRMPSSKEENKSDKTEIKELSKEDKLKSLKERYMQRKLNQNTSATQEGV